MTVMSPDLMGVGEVAERLGVSRQRVDQLTREHADFPEPVEHLRSGRVWKKAAIEAWIASHPERPGGRPRKQQGGGTQEGRRGRER